LLVGYAACDQGEVFLRAVVVISLPLFALKGRQCAFDDFAERRTAPVA
jgi:hypothetical protein